MPSIHDLPRRVHLLEDEEDEGRRGQARATKQPFTRVGAEQQRSDNALYAKRVDERQAALRRVMASIAIEFDAGVMTLAESVRRHVSAGVENIDELERLVVADIKRVPSRNVLQATRSRVKNPETARSYYANKKSREASAHRLSSFSPLTPDWRAPRHPDH